MDIARSLKDAENAMRDFLEYILERNLGDTWTAECGIPSENIDKWREIKANAESGLVPTRSDEKLMFYAPFDDLIELINANWEGDLESAFTERERILSYLKIIEEYRNPDLLRRELFVHQKHLLLGVSGEIRSRIAAYRSLMELGKEGFPRIEYVKDSFGNLWVPGKPRRVKTNLTLKTGTRIEFVVQASDPEELPIEYRIYGDRWQAGNILFLDAADKHVKKQAQINITIRSSRKYHAYPLGYDDRVVFEYQITP